MEQIEAEIDTIPNYDYLNEVTSPEASNFEHYPISSYNIFSIGVPLAFETSADPHTSFWREPFSLENIYDDIDEYAAYVAPQFGMPHPECWFGGPSNPYYDML